MKKHMDCTLVLNSSYQPLKIVSWQRAIILLYKGKVEVLEEYEREIRSVSFAIKLPSVLRLLKVVKVNEVRKGIKLCRANIYIRDNYICQYCGGKHEPKDLTLDHVIPVVKGGRKSWDNIVTACFKCNKKKGGKTPKEARMKILKTPKEPKWLSTLIITLKVKNVPDSWRYYLGDGINLLTN